MTTIRCAASIRPFTSQRHQRGAVLVIAIVFLILLTLIALTATSASILQERMTGGMRNQQLGLMGAETTLRGGEAFLWKLSFDGSQPLPPCEGTGTDCVYRPDASGVLNSTVQTFRSSKEWLPVGSDGGRAYENALSGLTGNAITANLGSEPRYIIENLGPNVPPGAGQQRGTREPEGTTLAGKHEWYRITSRSQGGSDAVVRVAESVYSALDLTNTGFNPGATP